MQSTRILLVDNGSLEAATTLCLRQLSKEVSLLIGQEVHPVSVLHSQKVSPTLLNNQPAQIFADAVQQAVQERISKLIVLPLFLGPSLAITEFIPAQFQLHATNNMQLIVANTLYGPDGELRDILIDNLKSTNWHKDKTTVLLCDHGTPILEVNRVRNELAKEIREKLSLNNEQLIACSMERREGDQYAFNEPLLESALSQVSNQAIILMQFLLPGRHAGPGGDVAEICEKNAPSGVIWELSPLIGQNTKLPHLLARRFKELKA
ncbi:MAG: cobalamin biosynthesis protein CbiX [Betaproteobacteria bacterium]|nr:cobalamin biosynthesis protein CbiX [Betaproteobacteria bacterium]